MTSRVVWQNWSDLACCTLPSGVEDKERGEIELMSGIEGQLGEETCISWVSRSTVQQNYERELIAVQAGLMMDCQIVLASRYS